MERDPLPQGRLFPTCLRPPKHPAKVIAGAKASRRRETGIPVCRAGFGIMLERHANRHVPGID
jgi:hypothetical protein